MQVGDGQGPGEGQNVEQLFNSHRVSFWGSGNILEIDRGGGYTTLCTYQMSLNFPFEKAHFSPGWYGSMN